MVNLERIAANLRALRERARPARILCAVKADAYGHGAREVVRAIVAEGVDMLAVATPQEALELTDVAAHTPILLLGPLPAGSARELAAADVRLTISTPDEARAAAEAARQTGARVHVHVNVDTGMGRVGVASDGVTSVLDAIARAGALCLEGLYTHFPTADQADDTFAHEQIAAFREVIADARRRGFEVPLTHAANSAGVLALEDACFDMVRVGIALYGLYPSPECRQPIELAPAMSVVSAVAQIREFPVGATVGYGRTFTTQRRTRAGVIPVGYADGYSRALSNRAIMQVRGVPCPVIGRVSMDLTMIDLTDVPAVSVGDKVIVYSGERADPNSVEETAKLLATIPYEIVTALGSRVRRVYTSTTVRPPA